MQHKHSTHYASLTHQPHTLRLKLGHHDALTGIDVRARIPTYQFSTRVLVTCLPIADLTLPWAVARDMTSSACLCRESNTSRCSTNQLPAHLRVPHVVIKKIDLIWIDCVAKLGFALHKMLKTNAVTTQVSLFQGFVTSGTWVAFAWHDKFVPLWAESVETLAHDFCQISYINPLKGAATRF